MAGWEKNNVVFEVWYVEAEKSVYRTTDVIVTKPASYREDEKMKKVVQPFVSRRLKDGKKCLKGYYTSYPKGKMTIMCLELDIDKVSDKTSINWMDNKIPHCRNTYEIENSLRNYKNLRCGTISIEGKNYLIRFGKHTVQLWDVNPDGNDDGLIKDEDKLLYIRAYKGPDYGIDYSFRETWKIDSFESIKFIGGDPSGRLLVNITELTEETEEDEVSNSYHTEEIFLPLDELSTTSTPPDEPKMSTVPKKASTTIRNDNSLRFDYHKLESACQALHFLFNSTESFTNVEDQDKFNTNLTQIRTKTENLILASLNSFDINSNYFSTIAGSRTLAMLASFKTGRKIIFMIVKQSIPISIFSYVRSQSEINQSNPQETQQDIIDREEYENSLLARTQSVRTEEVSLENDESKDPEGSNMPTPSEGVSYRSAPLKPVDETANKNSLIASNENVLTVLIHELSYDLYKLLFNRILSDSKRLGPGCLSSLTDALLFLQEEGNSDLLLSSSQKLSYLEIEKDRLAILSSEIFQVMKVKELQKESISSIRTLESHATMEQIKKYNGRFSIQMYHIRKRWRSWYEQRIWWKNFKKPIVIFYKFNIRNPWRKLFIESKKEAKQLSKVCVVPLPHFNSYSSFPEDRPKNTKYDDGKVIPYKKNSAFVSVALDQHDNNMFRQGDTVLEVLLEYKWQNFARNKFIWICLIHTIYYISYCTGVLFAPELYDINLEEDFVLDHPGQIVSLILMLLSLLVLIGQEIRQFIETQDKIDYIFSGYNLVDICSFVFPIVTLMQLVCNLPNFSEVCSVATLILWTHAILRLRVISYFGVTLETIIQLSKNIGSVLFIMLLVILAFTQSYMVLLRLSPDEYFQDNFEGSFAGDVTSETGSLTAEGTVGFAGSSADNGFVDPFKAFYQVWLFIYGVWDPIIEGDAGDSKMIMALSIVFSLITVLIFFNMVIALMSSTVEAVEKRGKKVWVSHFAAVVSEIELLWCSNETKHSRKNNPIYIYYIASFDSVSLQEKKLLKETKELTDELEDTFSSKKP
ncbi:hypothetical protein BDF21DRAFT_490379 [Thamnidium elegans]|nr:hypothetical protein BDF21DRAFT_490379 [Thamnidium elegans]